MSITIPVLDWSRFESGADRDGFVADLGKACRETGFFLVSGHGIPESLISETFRMADAFFDLPEAEKAPLDIRKFGTNRGWTAEGSENLDDTTTQVDRKEAFNIGLDMAADDPRILSGEPFRGINHWPVSTRCTGWASTCTGPSRWTSGLRSITSPRRSMRRSRP